MMAARLVAVVAFVALCAGCGGTTGPSQPALLGTLVAPASAAPAFSLSDQTGRPVSMTAQRGHYVVVTFLYTHCPDVCPVIAGMLNRVLQTSAAKRAGLRVLAVSVDPTRDTPAAVRRVGRLHQLVPAFRYLTGTRAELQPVWNGFHVASITGPDAAVSHSAIEYLIDPRGRERLIYDATVTTATVVHDLTALEAEQ